ncbi:hypothetical protein, partial [Paenibacillus marchantiophytorum]|uniref:hypothetical protein n=1 Tax=Paenibacillus marchantiophytorum TaxID=1619310 RepID=UPI001E625487
WVGLGWVGLGWVGLGWVGLGWVGLGWVGLGWVGLDQSDRFDAPQPYELNKPYLLKMKQFEIVMNSRCVIDNNLPSLCPDFAV